MGGMFLVLFLGGGGKKEEIRGREVTFGRKIWGRGGASIVPPGNRTCMLSQDSLGT